MIAASENMFGSELAPPDANSIDPAFFSSLSAISDGACLSLVGKKHDVSSSKWLSLVSPKQRLHIYSEAWKRSNLPLPNELITLNFPLEQLDGFLSRGGTVSAFRGSIMTCMLRWFRSRNLPWLHIWVIEVKNGPHAHIAIWLPGQPGFRRALLSELMRLCCGPNLPPSEVLTATRRRDSGLPVQMSRIVAEKAYRATGRAGLDGLVDYMAKDLYENSFRTRGRPLGRLVGASATIVELGRGPAGWACLASVDGQGQKNEVGDGERLAGGYSRRAFSTPLSV